MSNKYLSNFIFIGSSIRHFEIKNDFVDLNPENAEKNLDVSHQINSINKLDDDNSLMGIITLNVKVSLKEDDNIYSVSLSIEGCYRAPKELGEEQFSKMLQVNGVTSLYSIARAFIQSTTSQTLLSGNILLPMFNVVAYSKDLNSKND